MRERMRLATMDRLKPLQMRGMALPGTQGRLPHQSGSGPQRWRGYAFGPKHDFTASAQWWLNVNRLTLPPHSGCRYCGGLVRPIPELGNDQHTSREKLGRGRSFSQRRCAAWPQPKPTIPMRTKATVGSSSSRAPVRPDDIPRRRGARRRQGAKTVRAFERRSLGNMKFCGRNERHGDCHCFLWGHNRTAHGAVNGV